MTKKLNVGIVIDRMCRRKKLSRGKLAREAGLFDRTIRSWMEGVNAGVVNVDCVLRQLGCRLAVLDDKDRVIFDQFSEGTAAKIIGKAVSGAIVDDND